MSMYETSAKLIRKELDYLIQMCDQAYDLELCDTCPISQHCVRATSIEDMWSEVSENTLAEFLYFADTAISDEDAFYISEDNKRKMLIEDED